MKSADLYIDAASHSSQGITVVNTNLDCTSLGTPNLQALATIMMPTTEPLALNITRPRAFRRLCFRKTTRRPPGAGEVELQIQAVSLNFKDVLKILGWLSDDILRNTFLARRSVWRLRRR